MVVPTIADSQSMDWSLCQRHSSGTRLTAEEIEAVDAALLLHTIGCVRFGFRDVRYVTPYTSTKMNLDTLETTVSFVSFHDGIHLGSVLALAKLV